MQLILFEHSKLIEIGIYMMDNRLLGAICDPFCMFMFGYFSSFSFPIFSPTRVCMCAHRHFILFSIFFFSSEIETICSVSQNINVSKTMTVAVYPQIIRINENILVAHQIAEIQL